MHGVEFEGFLCLYVDITHVLARCARAVRAEWRIRRRWRLRRQQNALAAKCISAKMPWSTSVSTWTTLVSTSFIPIPTRVPSAFHFHVILICPPLALSFIPIPIFHFQSVYPLHFPFALYSSDIHFDPMLLLTLLDLPFINGFTFYPLRNPLFLTPHDCPSSSFLVFIQLVFFRHLLSFALGGDVLIGERGSRREGIR